MNRQWSWHGVAGVILTTAVGVGWAAAMIILAVRDRPLTDAGGTVITTLGGALIGAVATWLGLTSVHHIHQDQQEEGES